MVDRRCAITQSRPVLHQALDRILNDALRFGIKVQVGSSRIKIGAFLSSARAIEIRCLSPPESRTPNSPTTVA